MKGKYWSKKFRKLLVSLIQLNEGIGLGASIDIMWRDVIAVNVTLLFWSLTLELWIRKYGEDSLKVDVGELSVASNDSPEK